MRTPTMKITQRSPEVCYITIENEFGKHTFYIDNSTGEQIMQCWDEEEDAIKTMKEIWNA